MNRLPKLAGLIPFSATDWPGKLTATAFTQGCPWRCSYCHNPQLQPFAGGTDFAAVFDLLEQRRGLLDGLVISGGEPTAQPGLATSISHVHDMGFPVGLHTCGYAPHRLSALLADPAARPDWIGLDIKGLPEDLPRVVGRPRSMTNQSWLSLGIVSEAGVPAQIRTTVWPGSTLEAHLPELRARVAEYGFELVVQYARGVDSQGRYAG